MGRHGAGHAVALSQVTAHAQQHVAMRACFHPLGNHAPAKGFGQPDHTLDDGQVIGAAQHVADEALVNFEHAGGQTLEVSERRVPGAKIVQRKAHAQSLALAHDG